MLIRLTNTYSDNDLLNLKRCQFSFLTYVSLCYRTIRIYYLGLYMEDSIW